MSDETGLVTGGQIGAEGDKAVSAGSDVSLEKFMEDAWDAASKPETEEKAPEEDKAEAPSEEPKEAKEEEKEPEPEAKEQEEEAPKKSTIKPPSSWNKDEVKTWETLTEEAQKAVIRREKDLNKERATLQNQVHQLKQKIQPVLELEGTIESRSRLYGLKSEEYLQNLIKADEVAFDEPLKYVKNFIEAHNIDLRALAEGADDLAYDERGHQATKRERELQAELEYYKQQQEAYEFGQQQEQEEQTTQYAEATIEQFLADKDENQARLFWPHVEQISAAVLESNPGADLTEVLDFAWQEVVSRAQRAFIANSPVVNGNGTGIKKGATLKSKVTASGTKPQYKTDADIDHFAMSELSRLFG